MKHYYAVISCKEQSYVLARVTDVNRDEATKRLKYLGYNVTRIFSEKAYNFWLESGIQKFIRKYPNYSYKFCETLFSHVYVLIK